MNIIQSKNPNFVTILTFKMFFFIKNREKKILASLVLKKLLRRFVAHVNLFLNVKFKNSAIKNACFLF